MAREVVSVRCRVENVRELKTGSYHSKNTQKVPKTRVGIALQEIIVNYGSN